MRVQRATLLPYVMILPSVALAIWIIGYPIYDVAHTSLHDVNRFGQVRDFAGAANFAGLLADPIAIASFWRTILWIIAILTSWFESGIRCLNKKRINRP